MAQKMTLEQLLVHCAAKSVPATVKPVMGRDGRVEFYIHADGVDSETLDFSVTNNELRPLDRAAGG